MKAQASFDFLMTYSWAFLAITIVIAAVYSFGWVDIGSVLPHSCQFFGQINCEESALRTTPPNIQFSITNGFNADLEIFSASVTEKNVPICTSFAGPVEWNRSENIILNISGCPSDLFTQNERIDVSVNLTFFRRSASCDELTTSCHHSAIGIISGKVD